MTQQDVIGEYQQLNERLQKENNELKFKIEFKDREVQQFKD